MERPLRKRNIHKRSIFKTYTEGNINQATFGMLPWDENIK